MRLLLWCAAGVVAGPDGISESSIAWYDRKKSEDIELLCLATLEDFRLILTEEGTSIPGLTLGV